MFPYRSKVTPIDTPVFISQNHGYGHVTEPPKNPSPCETGSRNSGKQEDGIHMGITCSWVFVRGAGLLRRGEPMSAVFYNSPKLLRTLASLASSSATCRKA